jgi:aldehyde dehydrogenase (NAD(P)+)
VLDVLYHSFVEGGVCLLKMSPVNAYLGPFFERAFAPLIEPGYLGIVYGGGDVGSYLSSHPAVDSIHVTGSVETHDSIVWGPAGAERERRRKANEPLTHKRVTSELGNVSPVLVVPARYSEREIDAAARNIVGMVVQNGSFNCNAAKIVVTARGWPQRAALLERIKRVLSDTPTRLAYYPGARERFESLQNEARGADSDSIGEASDGKLPWAFFSGLDASQDSPLFQKEPFCSIFSEATVAADDALEFLSQATHFANERLWGTLNAMLIAPSSVERDPVLKRGLDRAVAGLRYGTVAINVWPAVGYGLGAPPWGGYPGATLADVQSGIGWGHNAFLLEHVEKVVVDGPLLSFPEPFWYPGHAHLRELGSALTGVEAAPSLPGVLRAAWAAVRP